MIKFVLVKKKCVKTQPLIIILSVTKKIVCKKRLGQKLNDNNLVLNILWPLRVPNWTNWSQRGPQKRNQGQPKDPKSYVTIRIKVPLLTIRLPNPSMQMSATKRIILASGDLRLIEFYTYFSPHEGYFCKHGRSQGLLYKHRCD